MKTKKISWQAIAIVVLALVLIASIALGVSGAWFQDRDDEVANVTMGEEVTLDILDANGIDEPVTWNKFYKDTTEAFPGDTVLKTLSIKMTTDTPAIVRLKISAKIYNADGEEVTPTGDTAPTAPTYPEFRQGTGNESETVAQYEARLATYETELATFEAANDLYLLKNINEGVAYATNWLEGKDGYVYYNAIEHAAGAVLAVNSADIILDTGLTNNVAEYEIVITVTAEAFQAANVGEDQAPAGLTWASIPTDVQTLVNNYNDGRLKDAA